MRESLRKIKGNKISISKVLFFKIVMIGCVFTSKIGTKEDFFTLLLLYYLLLLNLESGIKKKICLLSYTVLNP